MSHATCTSDASTSRHALRSNDTNMDPATSRRAPLRSKDTASDVTIIPSHARRPHLTSDLPTSRYASRPRKPSSDISASRVTRDTDPDSSKSTLRTKDSSDVTGSQHHQQSKATHTGSKLRQPSLEDASNGSTKRHGAVPLSTAASNVTARLSRKFEPISHRDLSAATTVHKLGETARQSSEPKQKRPNISETRSTKSADVPSRNVTDSGRGILAARQKRYLDSSHKDSTGISTGKPAATQNDQKLDLELATSKRKTYQGNERKLSKSENTVEKKRADVDREKTPPRGSGSPSTRKSTSFGVGDVDKTSESRMSPNRFGYMPSVNSFHSSAKVDASREGSKSPSLRRSVGDTQISLIPRSIRSLSDTDSTQKTDHKCVDRSDVRNADDCHASQNEKTDRINTTRETKIAKDPCVRRSQIIEQIQKSFEKKPDPSDEVFVDTEKSKSTRITSDKDKPAWRRGLLGVEKATIEGKDLGTDYSKRDLLVETHADKLSHSHPKKCSSHQKPAEHLVEAGTSSKLEGKYVDKRNELPDKGIKKDGGLTTILSPPAEIHSDKIDNVKKPFEKDIVKAKDNGKALSQKQDATRKTPLKSGIVERIADVPIPPVDAVQLTKNRDETELIDENKIKEKAERIRKYKEERRKQLSAIKDKFRNAESNEDVEKSGPSSGKHSSPSNSVAKKVPRQEQETTTTDHRSATRCNLEEKFMQKPNEKSKSDIDFQFARSRTPMKQVGEKSTAVLTAVSPKVSRRAFLKDQVVLQERPLNFVQSQQGTENLHGANVQHGKTMGIPPEYSITHVEKNKDVAAMVSRKLGLPYIPQSMSPTKSDLNTAFATSRSVSQEIMNKSHDFYNQNTNVNLTSENIHKSQSFDDATVLRKPISNIRSLDVNHDLASTCSTRKNNRNVGIKDSEQNSTITNTSRTENPSVCITEATPRSQKHTRDHIESNKELEIISTTPVSSSSTVSSKTPDNYIDNKNVLVTYNNTKTSTPLPNQDLLTPTDVKSISPVQPVDRHFVESMMAGAATENTDHSPGGSSFGVEDKVLSCDSTMNVSDVHTLSNVTPSIPVERRHRRRLPATPGSLPSQGAGILEQKKETDASPVKMMDVTYTKDKSSVEDVSSVEDKSIKLDNNKRVVEQIESDIKDRNDAECTFGSKSKIVVNSGNVEKMDPKLISATSATSSTTDDSSIKNKQVHTENRFEKMEKDGKLVKGKPESDKAVDLNKQVHTENRFEKTEKDGKLVKGKAESDKAVDLNKQVHTENRFEKTEKDFKLVKGKPENDKAVDLNKQVHTGNKFEKTEIDGKLVKGKPESDKAVDLNKQVHTGNKFEKTEKDGKLVKGKPESDKAVDLMSPLWDDRTVSLTSSFSEDIAALRNMTTTQSELDDLFMHSSHYLEHAEANRRESSSEDAEKERLSRGARFRRSLKQRKSRSKSHSRVDEEPKTQSSSVKLRSKSRDRVDDSQPAKDRPASITDDLSAISPNSPTQDTTRSPREPAGRKEVFARPFTGLPHASERRTENDLISDIKGHPSHRSTSHYKGFNFVGKSTADQDETLMFQEGISNLHQQLTQEINPVDSEGTAASLTDGASSDPGKKKRKDKSSLRKSQLNKRLDAEDDNTQSAPVTVEPKSTLSSKEATTVTTSSSVNTTASTGLLDTKPPSGPPRVRAHELVPVADVENHPSLTDSPLNNKKLSNICYTRGKQFSDLLKKFSGSESGSDHSENELAAVHHRKSGLAAINTDEGQSTGLRRTPERTQSLRERVRRFEESCSSSDSSSKVVRSASVKGERRLQKKVETQSSDVAEVTADPRGRKDTNQTSVFQVTVKKTSDVSRPNDRVCDEKTWVEPLTETRVLKEDLSTFKKPTTLPITAQDKSHLISGNKPADKKLTTPDTPDTSTLSISELSNGSSNLDTAFEWLQDFDETSTDIDLDKLGQVSPIKEKIEHSIPGVGTDSCDVSVPRVLGSSRRRRELPQTHGDTGIAASDIPKDLQNDLSCNADVKHHGDLGVVDKVESSNAEPTAGGYQKTLDLHTVKGSNKTLEQDFVSKGDKQFHSAKEPKCDSTEKGESNTEVIGRTDSGVADGEMSSRVRLRQPKSPPKGQQPLRGILKRSSSDINRWSLNEPGNVDPELASFLRARRDEQSDGSDDAEVEEETQDIRDKVRKEIAEIQDGSTEPNEERRMSMSERIFQIQNKIEESLSSSTTPKLRSGGITPKQFSQDKDPSGSVGSVDGGKLMEKLEVVAGEHALTLEERRRRFQHRSHDDWRSRTHPVTTEEIEQAGSLHAVSNFRKLVTQKSLESALNSQSTDKFKQTTEFPQPYKKERINRRAARFKTAPITADELNAIPEDCALDPLREKNLGLSSGATSNADSGIISSSETEVGDEMCQMEKTDPAMLSVSARMSLFDQPKEETKVETNRREPRRDRNGTGSVGARWLIQRKKRERSQTQPVTDVEIKDASLLADEQTRLTGASDADVPGECDISDSDVSRLSVLEKMKLFSEKKIVEEPPPKEDHAPRRRNRKLSSRFATQPVTPEELQKAKNKISPLALSLVAPPDPDSLAGLSVKEQIAMMARNAEDTLASVKQRAVLDDPSTTLSPATPSPATSDRILKRSEQAASSSTDEHAEVRSILKHDHEQTTSSVEAQSSERRGILKHDTDVDKCVEPRSILKSGDSFDLSSSQDYDSEIHGILKTSDVSSEEISRDDIRSILKTPDYSELSSSEGGSELSQKSLKVAEKNRSDIGSQGETVKSILKSSDSSGFSKDFSQSSLRSDNESPKSILKRLSLPENSIVIPEKSVLKQGGGSRERLSSPEKSSLKRNSLTEFSSPDRSSMKYDCHHEHSSPEKSSLKRNSLQDSDFSLSALLDRKPETSILKRPESVDASPAPSKGILKKDSIDRASDVSDILESSVSVMHNASTFSLSTITNVSSDVLVTDSLEFSPLFVTATASPDKSSSDAVSPTSQSTGVDSSLDTNSHGTTSLDSQSPELPRVEAPANDSLDISDSEKSATTPVKRQGSRGKNDAVTRRRVAKELRKSQVERYLTQPTEPTPDATEQKKQLRYGATRHFTQPVTPEEKQVAEDCSLDNTPGSSILDRMNSLKKRSEEQWRHRIAKNLDIEFDQSEQERKTARSSIADRLNKLGAAQQVWQNRVTESDAKAFTVEGKLNLNKPGNLRIQQCNDLEESDLKDSGPLLSPPREKIPVPKQLITSAEQLPASPTASPTTSPKQFTVIESPENAQEKSQVIEVPTIDEALVESFFSSSRQSDDSDRVDVTIDDFDDLFLKSENWLQPTVRIRPKRHHISRARNPLKTMSVQLESSYTEMSTGVADREFRRLKRETIARDAGMAQSMLAEAAIKGLKAKESFSVELRKVTKDSGTPGSQVRHDPYKDIMLLQVKGRRQVQTRLVEPCAKSINSGDCFVLVTPDKVFNWIGEYSNVIEKSKSAELASYIQQKKDLAFKGTEQVFTVMEPNMNRGAARSFWEVLGGFSKYQEAGPPDEDVTYESHLTDTNMVYKVSNNTLVPFEKYWGSLPRHEMLSNQEVLVLDFGSELYVWHGSRVSMEQRKMGMKLARQLWEQGYDYSMCNINPLYPLRDDKDDHQVAKHGTARPSWCLFGKVNQNMETVLFREKFIDWPDESRLLRVKRQISKDSSTVEISDLKPYDAKLMITENRDPVTLVLEGSNVGRGQMWVEDMDGIMREQEIKTLGVAMWHVMEFDRVELTPGSYGQFHEGDTYVVRWQYVITATGMRTLKGTSSTRKSGTGRERCAYFFWQGHDSTINEKGASALMTVELDEERGPQVRVEQGKEPPCFMNLFHGSAIIHRGKREDASTNTQGSWRFYAVRGERSNETCLVEIARSAANLRSRSSYVLLNSETGAAYVWHGAKATQTTRALAKSAANNLKSRCPEEVGLVAGCSVCINEVTEGAEGREWWAAMGGRQQRNLYLSLSEETRVYTHTPRLFHLQSISGEFVATEILYSLRSSDLTSPMPFLQSQIYTAEQPALFLLDNHHEVFLWQGWWPDPTQDQGNVHTGSAEARFIADRRCALETTLHYCREKCAASPPKAWLVCAGVEPMCFTNVFPFWDIDASVQEKASEGGHSNSEMIDAADLLDKMTNTRYPFSRLMERPLPDWVDPLRLETYLTDEDFVDVLGMSRDEFAALPSWKQIKQKQDLGLF